MSPIATILRRVTDELRKVAAKTGERQEAVGGWSFERGFAASALNSVDLQDLDRATQEVAAIAAFLEALSTTCPAEWVADPKRREPDDRLAPRTRHRPRPQPTPSRRAGRRRRARIRDLRLSLYGRALKRPRRASPRRVARLTAAVTTTFTISAAKPMLTSSALAGRNGSRSVKAALASASHRRRRRPRAMIPAAAPCLVSGLRASRLQTHGGKQLGDEGVAHQQQGDDRLAALQSEVDGDQRDRPARGRARSSPRRPRESPGFSGRTTSLAISVAAESEDERARHQRRQHAGRADDADEPRDRKSGSTA